MCLKKKIKNQNQPLLIEQRVDKGHEQALVNVIVDSATVDGLRQQRAQRNPRDFVGCDVRPESEQVLSKKKKISTKTNSNTNKQTNKQTSKQANKQ